MTSLSPVQTRALQATLARLTQPPRDSPVPGAAASVERIVELLLARPWRRSSVDAATADDTARKVGAAVVASRPIEFSLPFGGYRGWQLPSAPNPDWAEVFWIDYLRSFAGRIAAVHPPGVQIALSYVGGVMGWVNALPDGHQSHYIHILGLLLQHRSTPRLGFRLVDHADAYGGPAAVLALLQEREAAMPPPTAAELQRARRNLVWSHACSAGSPPLEARIVEAARRCAALMSLESRRAFNKFGPRLQISHLRGADLALHIGSCRSAVAQPWVSTGFLQWCAKRDAWIERLATAQRAGEPLSVVSVDHPLTPILPGLVGLPVLS
jgi:hypothetical protein